MKSNEVMKGSDEEKEAAQEVSVAMLFTFSGSNVQGFTTELRQMTRKDSDQK